MVLVRAWVKLQIAARLLVELGKHRLMIWRGLPNWPPKWNGPHGPDNPLPQGEVGILTRLETGTPSAFDPYCIAWNDQDYLGSLFFDELNFFNQIVAILRQHIGSPIAEIGSLNIPC